MNCVVFITELLWHALLREGFASAVVPYSSGSMEELIIRCLGQGSFTDCLPLTYRVLIPRPYQQLAKVSPNRTDSIILLGCRTLFTNGKARVISIFRLSGAGGTAIVEVTNSRLSEEGVSRY